MHYGWIPKIIGAPLYENRKRPIKCERTHIFAKEVTCADPEGEGGAGVRTPGKSQNNLASIQCWAIIGPPAKRHLNEKLAFRWQADYGPLSVVIGLSLPSSTEKKQQKNFRVESDPL